MDLLSNLTIGVIGGVVSAFLLWLFRVLLGQHFLPWYFQRVYRGINLDGKWHASEIGFTQDITLDIKQSAGKISGSARFALRSNESATPQHYEDVREFNVEGRIQDRYITLTLSHRNRQRIGVVAFVLEPFADGRQLRGQMSYVSVTSHCIMADPIQFARDPRIVRARREEILADLLEHEDEAPEDGEEDVPAFMHRPTDAGEVVAASGEKGEDKGDPGPQRIVP